ncbi:DNA protecting protein DprA [Syntrophotalea acetylenivorans]|uniref:DNA protecting protein DprA n=1 Tax=Syntrophotalea acetylenivorans TaxID=1842532 RepID=A0A1L3GT69_9BACT|nr:DNA protecting protein DprA [Syntrophotalea acetylenivorans]
MRLHLTSGLGRTGLIRLMDAFGSPATILAAGPDAWQQKAGIRPVVAAALPAPHSPQLLQTTQRLAELGVSIITFWDQQNYPSVLRTIYDPPSLLYVLGSLPQQQAFAVVGSRSASPSGRRLTSEICAELAARNITVVSGLARGIDSAAHQGALETGRTVAVLGCGIDVVYPPENADLAQDIIAQGAIVSEYPPGTPPLAGHFPGRNRIISGLAKGVLIVEAAEKSGSLLTADFALDQGREVFAVPGPVYAKTSSGTNRLLKDGAHLVTEARDILEVLWPASATDLPILADDPLPERLSSKQLTVYQSLGEEPLHIDELARKCSLTAMELSAILLHLELEGGAEQLPGMRYIRKRTPRQRGGL